MSTLNYLLLAVEDPLRSAELYDQILDTKPVDSAKTFVLYALPSGIKIGLWARADVKPEPKPAGGVEISFSHSDKDSVRKTHEAWKKLGLKIVQDLTEMDFGYTFVAEDPDGHRLRPFVLNDNPR